MTTSPQLSASGYDLRPLSDAERAKFAASLTDEERYVILNHGTERAFCGTLLGNKKAGIYACRLCGLPLFKADAKFESGTGWPSFYQPFDPAHHRRNRRSQPRHDAHGDSLQTLRRPSGARLSRRPAADAPALLPQLSVA